MLTKLPLFRLLQLFAGVLIMGTLAAACKKAAGITLPPSEAHFLNQRSGVYFITGPEVTDTIPVGVTTVSNSADRTISFTVSSPSGADSGTQYSLVSSFVRIQAGEAIGYIVVKGNYAFYNGTIRKDTLLFTLTDQGKGGITASDFNDSFTLVMRGPCVEGEDFDPAEFDGTYNNAVDIPPGSQPDDTYTVNISSTQTGPTSATLHIQDLASVTFVASSTDPTYNPGIIVNLDWSDPHNLKATIPSQLFENTYFDATIVGDSAGTFSSCHQTFTLNYDILIPAFGFDSGIFTTKISR
jgi:hypothetical protein